MPRIFVAYQTDEVDDAKRLADGSQTNLKKRMREHLDTNWALAFYSIKADVKTIVQIIEDLSEIEATSLQHYRVNAHGQVRKVDSESNYEATPEKKEKKSKDGKKKKKKKSKK